jgi:predicted ATPase
MGCARLNWRGTHPHLSPHMLLKRLEHRFDILSGGIRDLPSRQQTLRSAIDWAGC